MPAGICGVGARPARPSGTALRLQASSLLQPLIPTASAELHQGRRSCRSSPLGPAAAICPTSRTASSGPLAGRWPDFRPTQPASATSASAVTCAIRPPSRLPSTSLTNPGGGGSDRRSRQRRSASRGDQSVISVAALTRTGDLAPFSNDVATVDVAAPAGDMTQNPADGIVVPFNQGTQGPAAETCAYFEGTSTAVSHASGLADLLIPRVGDQGPCHNRGGAPTSSVQAPEYTNVLHK